MYLRFENDQLAEASMVTYRTAKYTWYPAPADYNPDNVYKLVNGAVVQATVQEEIAADLAAYKVLVQEKADELVDLKRLEAYPFRPGKEREYILKQGIAKTYNGDISTDPIGVALLSDEAAERGMTTDELAVLIQTTIDAQVSLMGSIAGLATACKNGITNATDLNGVDAAYNTLVSSLDAVM